MNYTQQSIQNHPALLTLADVLAGKDANHTRALNALTAAGFTHLGQFCFVSRVTLLRQSNVSNSTAELIEDVLKRHILPPVGKVAQLDLSEFAAKFLPVNESKAKLFLMENLKRIDAAIVDAIRTPPAPPLVKKPRAKVEIGDPAEYATEAALRAFKKANPDVTPQAAADFKLVVGAAIRGLSASLKLK